MSRVLILQHVPHERLGTFEDGFERAGVDVVPLNTYEPKAAWPRVSDVDGIVSMGGPQRVYEQATHPFLARELAFLKEALAAKRPILSVCLGAQLLAAALGAAVTKNPQKEIGWYPVMREPGADDDPLLEPFGQTETVFQWHGDTFTLPRAAVQLASSPLCDQQAFRYRDRVYGLQFHAEVTDAMIRAWVRANNKELATLKGVIDPAAIVRQNPQHLRRLETLCRHVASTFARLAAEKPVQRPPQRERVRHA